MSRWMFAALAAALFAVTASAADPPALFPFVLPWDDASPGVTDLSGWSEKPAGKAGPVRAGDDGHLYSGDRRVRFLGVNVCFSGCFPTKDDAEKIAAHMDMFPFPDGIRARKGDGTGELDPEALERLDAFTAALKNHGLYTNLNLLVSRPFNKGDGLPAEIEQVGWKERAVVGFFDERVLKLQREYARALLQHKNPHTGLTYAEDPAVAFVEINNENGLIHAWLGNQVDALPEVFLAELQKQWNAWLKKKYGGTDKLREAWGAADEELGEEMLTNADFGRGVEGWVLERRDPAEATASAADDLPEAVKKNAPKAKSVRLEVTREGTEGRHVKFNQGGLKLPRGSGRPYTLTFWAKADRPRTVTVEVGQAQEPRGNLGLQAEVKLTTDWQSFRFVVVPATPSDEVRVNFNGLGRPTGVVWLAGLSFRPGGVVRLGDKERLEDGTVSRLEHAHFGDRPAEAQLDWMRFLWETEDAYWQSMKRYLKEELGVKGVVVGTIVGCSSPNLMARLDAVDTHAYWQHPQFPNKPWDAEDWTVANKSMVNEPGGVLPGLALRRVFGKPHVVSEYSHPAPNTFASEGLPLLAAYGALQDWDAIYAFAYSHNADWDARRITGFFDIAQHPTKMATLPAVAAMFVRGDVQPYDRRTRVDVLKSEEIDALLTARPWELVHAGHFNIPGEVALVNPVGLDVDGIGRRPRVVKPGDMKVFPSRTEELLWDISEKGRGFVTVNAPKSKAVIGYGGGKKFDLGGVIIEPGPTSQDGWGVVTLTVMDGSLKGPGRLLITATGTAENTDMKWKSAAHDSVGRDWGKAPSLVEGVPARITLPVSAAGVKAWALDERGQRREALAVDADRDGKAVIGFGPKQRTLWYEVELK